MQVGVNDLSFQYQFFDKTVAIHAIIAFVELCRYLESDKAHSVCKIVTDKIQKDLVILPDVTFISLIQHLPKDVRSYLLSVLVNRAYPDEIDGIAPFLLDGKESYICNKLKDGIFVSLLSNEAFSKHVFYGIINQTKVAIRNISSMQHIKQSYARELGLRVYKANDKKHKKDKENAYGKNRFASRMDLDDVQAQMLLDKAILVKGRLYARKSNINYAFQNERECVYHGYQCADLSDDILRALDKASWE